MKCSSLNFVSYLTRSLLIDYLMCVIYSCAGGNRNNKKGTKLTLAAKFKADLDSLMTSLRATVPHFIRCVKPNAEQVRVLCVLCFQ